MPEVILFEVEEYDTLDREDRQVLARWLGEVPPKVEEKDDPWIDIGEVD